MLAADLAEGVPVVLGDGPLNGVAAMRAASMLARTARMPAMCGELPDDASQIVACFDGPFTSAFRGGANGGMGGAGTGGAGTGGDASAGERDIFADPYLDGRSRRRGWACSCCVTSSPRPPARRPPRWTR